MNGELLAPLGDFFVVEAAGAPGDWRPISALVAGPGLRERVDATGTALERIARADVEARVAASTTSLGLFARLLSPSLGAELLGVSGPSPEGLQWQPAPTGPLPLRATSWAAGSLDAVLTDVVEPLVDRLVDEHSLAENVVRGNVASAVVGSLRMAVAARPDLAAEAETLTSRLLATDLLIGTALARRPFVRRSCCLYYRIPGGGYCGDCILKASHV